MELNQDTLGLLMYIVLGAGNALVIPLVSYLLGPRRNKAKKMGTYECGLEPFTDARDRVSVKYYRVAMLFLLFDVEMVFLIPWAVALRSNAASWLFVAEMAVFLSILVGGLMIAWKKKALEWD